jgi:hypothetical protein
MKNIIKKSIIGFVSILLLGSFNPSLYTSSYTDKDYYSCFDKPETKWGEYCKECVEYEKGYKVKHDDTFVVYMKNKCSESIDVKCCVQENDKTWRCNQLLGLGEKGVIRGFACFGTGKYRYWVRKNGDKSVVFPSDEEINEQFKE